MATIEALRKSEQAFRALDECPETKEKLAILMKIEKYVLTDDPSYRCIESVLQNFLTLRHQESRPAPLRRYLAYFLEQVALRKSKMALRCVPACITLLEDPDSLTRQIVIQSARALQSRALLLIAKASTAQSSNVEAACQALSQLQERIWHILQYNVENANNEESTRIQNTPFHQACLFVAHQIIITTSSAVFVRPSIAVEQRGVASIEDIGANEFLPPATLTDKAGQRLQDLISLLDASLIGSQQLNKDPDHIVSLLEALSIIGRYRPQTLTKILEVFQRYANHDPWLDTLLSFHIRSFLACALDGDYHATCVHVLKKIDPSSAALPMENLIAVARQDQLRARAEEKINKLVKETLDLPFDGDTLLGTEQVVSASELVEADQSKYVEPYTLMTLRLNPKDAARICVSGIEKQLDSAKNFADSGSLRATKDLTAAAAAAGGGKGGAGGKPGTSVGIERKLITPESFLDEEGGEVVDPRARKRQKIKDSTKEQYLDTAVSKFEGSAASSEIQSLQQMVFGEVLAAKSRMQNSLQASCLADTSLRQFDAVNNRVISHLASFVEDPLLEEVFYGKAIGKALSGKNNETWQQDILPLFFAKYSSTVQRRMDAKQGANMRSLRNMLESVQDSEFTYGKLFQLFLRVYTTKFGGVTKKELREFLGSLPYLPESLFGKLENQCHVEGMPRKQALITCFYVAEKFPQSRAQAMRLLFKMAYTQNSPDGGPVISSSISDDSTSQTAIRFLAAKVYQPPATSSTSRSSGAGMLKRTSDGSMLTRSTTSSNNNSNKEGYVISLDALRSRDLEDMATLMLRSMVRYQRFDVPIEPSGYIRQIYEEITHHEHVVPEESRFWLFLAMSIKRPSLLTQLLEVYAIAEQASGNLEIIKKTLLEHIHEALKHISPVSEQGNELLRVIEETQRVASLDLIGKMLRILLQEILDAYAALENDEARKQMTPNLPLNFRDVVVAKHESLGNAKILIPVLPLVSRADCVRYLAAILNSQTVTLEEVKWTTRHLVRTANHAELLGEGQMAEVLAIPELISEIHHFNTTDGDMVQTARSIHALNSIFELLELNELEPEKYVFAIQSLAEEEEEAPMPTLIFRTLIQLQKHSEFFNDFITSEILPRLVKKPVLFAERRNSRAGLTEGLKFSLKISFEKMPDQRIPAKVLSMLPLHQLEDLMATFPEWKQHLKEYCQTQPLHLIPHHVRQLLH